MRPSHPSHSEGWTEFLAQLGEQLIALVAPRTPFLVSARDHFGAANVDVVLPSALPLDEVVLKGWAQAQCATGDVSRPGPWSTKTSTGKPTPMSGDSCTRTGPSVRAPRSRIQAAAPLAPARSPLHSPLVSSEVGAP